MWFKMTLTPSDVASLTSTLSFWEYAEYISGGFVALACVGEYIASFKPWFTGGDKERKDRLEKRSTLLLIIALAAELICLVRTNLISGQVIGALDTKAAEAYRNSGKAIANADTAAGKAKAASDEADTAKVESSKAKQVSATAESVARAARQEADSFEKRIASAVAQANEEVKRAGAAESHLSEALRAAEEVTHKLEAIEKRLAPRVLTKEQQDRIVAIIAHFSGQEVFFAVYDDLDSRNLLATVRSIVKSANWTLVRPLAYMGDIALMVSPAPADTVGYVSKQGIWILAADGHAASGTAAATLAAALAAEGLQCESHRTPDFKGSAIAIIIGKKP